MSYVICKDPGIRMDMMVKKKYAPQLVGYIRQKGCTYTREIEKKIRETEEEWIVLMDITGKNGKAIGGLLEIFCCMDWESKVFGDDDKFYILLNRRKGKKKYVQKNRSQAGTGRKDRTGGESAGAADTGHADADYGKPGDGGSDGTDDIRHDLGREGEACDGDRE